MRATAVFLLVSLSACTFQQDQLYLTLANDQAPSCETLRGRVVLGDAEASGRARSGESATFTLRIPEQKDDLLVEAWCTEGEQEIGYTRINAPYRSARVPTVIVLPAPEETERCVSGETRGEGPCIVTELY